MDRSRWGSNSLAADYRLALEGSSLAPSRDGFADPCTPPHNPAVAVHPLLHLIDRPLPDLALPASDGSEFNFRQYVGRSPLVLFFYLLNGTPG